MTTSKETHQPLNDPKDNKAKGNRFFTIFKRSAQEQHQRHYLTISSISTGSNNGKRLQKIRHRDFKTGTKEEMKRDS